MITGSFHGTNGISGNKITLAQVRISFLHIINKLLYSSLLLSATQRHSLWTKTHNVKVLKALCRWNVMCMNASTYQWTKWSVWVQPSLDFSSLDHIVDTIDAVIDTNQLQSESTGDKITQMNTPNYTTSDDTEVVGLGCWLSPSDWCMVLLFQQGYVHQQKAGLL